MCSVSGYFTVSAGHRVRKLVQKHNWGLSSILSACREDFPQLLTGGGARCGPSLTPLLQRLRGHFIPTPLIPGNSLPGAWPKPVVFISVLSPWPLDSPWLSPLSCHGHEQTPPSPAGDTRLPGLCQLFLASLLFSVTVPQILTVSGALRWFPSMFYSAFLVALTGGLVQNVPPGQSQSSTPYSEKTYATNSDIWSLTG